MLHCCWVTETITAVSLDGCTISAKIRYNLILGAIQRHAHIALVLLPRQFNSMYSMALAGIIKSFKATAEDMETVGIGCL